MRNSFALPHDIAEKNAELESSLRKLKHIALALSGGLDSRFLAYTARRVGVDVLALHVSGPHVPAAESAATVAWAKQKGIPCATLQLDPVALPLVRANSKERCYYCKQALFTALRDAAGSLPLCDGTNASDGNEYRPGLRALRELNVLSPLAAAGLAKDDIRAVGRATGLDRSHQAARPCLLTRFNYGVEITAQVLTALDTAEHEVEKTLRRHGALRVGSRPEDAATADVADFRLRLPEPESAVLHLALPSLSPELQRDLEAVLASASFAHAPIVLVQKVSGHFDRPEQPRER